MCANSRQGVAFFLSYTSYLSGVAASTSGEMDKN